MKKSLVKSIENLGWIIHDFGGSGASCRIKTEQTTKNTEQRPTIRGGNVAATVASPLNSRKIRRYK